MFIGPQPCQLISERETLYLKKIKLWASQKMVQDFILETTPYENVIAQMVAIKMHTTCCKNLQDIGWLLHLDDGIAVLPIDHIRENSFHVSIDKVSFLSAGACFGLNGQRYIIAEDSENGQFIAKHNPNKKKNYESLA